MTPAAVAISFEIVAILITLGVIMRTVPLQKSGKNPMAVALFLFSLVSLMFSFAYWLTYTLIRQEMRMPFAANEIGEIAWFLLLASSLETVFRNRDFYPKKETIFTLVFVVASVALWIGWSGEWLQDIIYGFAFGYFLLTCVKSLKQTDALSKTQWRILGISCAVIIFSQAGTFFVPEGAKKPLDLFCYALMFTVLIWLFVKSVLMIKDNNGAKAGDTKSALAMAFSVSAFAFSTLYMSSGWFYLAALTFCLAALPLKFIALRREVSA